jgi:hypothetical protein
MSANARTSVLPGAAPVRTLSEASKDAVCYVRRAMIPAGPASASSLHRHPHHHHPCHFRIEAAHSLGANDKIGRVKYLAGNRTVAHPVNSRLNYAYAALESEIRIIALSDGYDPMIG